jgi:hypothetical protein
MSDFQFQKNTPLTGNGITGIWRINFVSSTLYLFDGIIRAYSGALISSFFVQFWQRLTGLLISINSNKSG